MRDIELYNLATNNKNLIACLRHTITRATHNNVRHAKKTYDAYNQRYVEKIVGLQATSLRKMPQPQYT